MAPVELVHQPPYVISVVLHAEGALDYRRDARRCPQFSTVSVGDGALQEHAEQALLLGGRQPWRPARRRPYLERFRAATPKGIPPAHNGTGSASKPTRDSIQRQSAPQQCDGTPPTVFQDVCRTFGPHDGRPPVEVSTSIALFTQESITNFS